MSEEPPRELRPIGALLLLAIHGLGFLVLVSIGAAIAGEDAQPSMVLLVGARLASVLIALYVGLTRYAPSEPTAVALRLARPDAGTMRIILLAFGYGLLIAPLLVALAQATAPAETPEAAEAARVALAAPGALWVNLIGFVFVNPLLDELLYRGLIQPRLVRGVGVVRGILLATLFYVSAQPMPRPELLPVLLLFAAPLGPIAHAAASTWAVLAAVLAVVTGGLLIETLAAPVAWWAMALSGAAAAGVLAIIWRVRQPR